MAFLFHLTVEDANFSKVTVCKWLGLKSKLCLTLKPIFLTNHCTLDAFLCSEENEWLVLKKIIPIFSSTILTRGHFSLDILSETGLVGFLQNHPAT